MDSRKKTVLWIIIIVLLLVGFFILTKYASTDFLKNLGISLPLPLFTFIIALVDGFNPCNLFVLTLLIGLLVSASHSREKIYITGYTFIAVVYVIYFLFMATWLNVFKFVGFIDPLRYSIAAIAILAGVVNCKELFFFRKGITLMIQDKHKAPLVKRIERVKEVFVKGSIPMLISASVVLAAFASLVELPCTAGFPLIYTGVLAGKVLETSFSYYAYLLFYNLVYILPLSVIIGIFGCTMKAKQISKRQMQVIKFIGGAIMLLLGLILLINPEIIGL